MEVVKVTSKTSRVSRVHLSALKMYGHEICEVPPRLQTQHILVDLITGVALIYQEMKNMRSTKMMKSKDEVDQESTQVRSWSLTRTLHPASRASSKRSSGKIGAATIVLGKPDGGPCSRRKGNVRIRLVDQRIGS
jgi:biotin carboxylase